MVSELFVDPPDLEDLAEKSSRFFLATESVDPGAGEGEAWLVFAPACPPSVEEEL